MGYDTPALDPDSKILPLGGGLAHTAEQKKRLLSGWLDSDQLEPFAPGPRDCIMLQSRRGSSASQWASHSFRAGLTLPPPFFSLFSYLMGLRCHGPLLRKKKRRACAMLRHHHRVGAGGKVGGIFRSKSPPLWPLKCSRQRHPTADSASSYQSRPSS